MARSMWSGRLQLNPLFGVAVQAVKATDVYDGDVPLREVCECHHRPFLRSAVCEGGRRRLTGAMERAGDLENTTRMVKAVEHGERFVVIADATLDQINEAVSSKVIEPAAVIEYGEAPMEHVTGTYYLQAERKDASSKRGLAVIHHQLQRTGRVIVAQWGPRTSERLVVIHPVGEVLVMNTVLYAQEVREPDADLTAHAREQASDQELDMCGQLLDTFPDQVDFAAFEDRKVALKTEAIAAAVKGKPIPTSKPAALAPAPADVLAALQAAVSGGKAKGKANGRRAVAA